MQTDQDILAFKIVAMTAWYIFLIVLAFNGALLLSLALLVAGALARSIVRNKFNI